MTPQDNIRWYWDDLSSTEKTYLLAELYESLSDSEKDRFLRLTNNN